MQTNQGTFIKYYFKPLPTLFYYVSEMVDLKGFGMLVFGIGAFIWSSLQLGIEWTPLRILLLPVMLAGGSLIFVSLMLLASSATFWIKDSFSILAFVSGFRDHARYPLGIYNSFFQFLFTFVVPIGYIAYFPAQFYLTSSVPDWTAWASPIFGAGLFALGLWVWNRGTRRWGATGS
jgi:ABC-2 type transport system permease protein